MDLGLDGRVYLVTGGSRGLGFAAAQALVADGARVVLSAPHEGTAASAAARLGAGESVTGTGGSIVFVLASSVRVPLAELAIGNQRYQNVLNVRRDTCAA